MFTPINKETRIIYMITLVALTMLIGSLHFITVEISTAAPAIIRPTAEVSIIRSPFTGRVLESHATENARVNRGALLYLIDCDQLRGKSSACRARIEQEQKSLEDVRKVLKESLALQPIADSKFQTPLYRQVYRTFHQALAEANTTLIKVQNEFRRQEKLYEVRVIPTAEYENFQFELAKAENARMQLLEVNRNHWEEEIRKMQENIQTWTAELNAIKIDLAAHRIVAPVNGTLQNLTGVYSGSFVYANQELSSISPDTSVLVLAYVTPDHIADVVPGMVARLQIDAFHHHQWGQATGYVTEVAQDSKIINDQWVYEVRCTLEKNYLTHTTGRLGYLKKGMTLRAHFRKYDQTVWNLLYQKADDRINPYSNRP